MRKALITGITGQDGSYLAEHLLHKGYEVHGMVRRVAAEDPCTRYGRIMHLPVTLHLGSLENFASIISILQTETFSEIYHLAAQSDVSQSFNDGFSTIQTNVNGTQHVLEAVRCCCPESRFYFAGSSEMFGNSRPPQNEETLFQPCSPYGISKLTGYHLMRHYRETYGMFCCCGILFNHESPRRGREFVTRKITTAVAQIKLGFPRELRLGNIEAKRDWGHAADYVEAMHLMLMQDGPDDYVIATGETRSVKQFCEAAFAYVNMDYREFVTIDGDLFRPNELRILLGNSMKAREKLGWKPKRNFQQLVQEMVEEDINRMKRETA